MIKKLFVFCIILINLNFIYAQNCGGDVECQCGDIIIDNYIMKYDLICDGDALSFKNGRDFNCNGHKIIGNGSGKAFSIIGTPWSKIYNCNIKNFDIGVYFEKRFYNGDDYISDKTQIHNNIFQNNSIGIYYNNAYSYNKIYSNVFKNNIKAGIEIANANNGYIWNNSFYQTGIYYSTQPSTSFCNNGISNNYFNGAIGPLCNCLVPYDNLRIIRDINFCSGDYYLPNGVGVYTNSNSYIKNVDIICDSTKLVGNGSNSGITLAGTPDGLIKGCFIENYENGILLTRGSYTSKYNIITYDSVRAIIINNTIINVNNGINMTSNSFAQDIHQNNIIANNYNLILKNLIYFSNADENFWGSNNLTYVLSKISNVTNNFEVNPFIIKDDLADLEIKSGVLVDGNVILKIENNGNLFSPHFNIKVIETFNDDLVKEEVIRFDKLIEPSSAESFDFDWNFERGNNLKIFLDYDDRIQEINELNNFYQIDFEPLSSNKFYLNVNLQPSVLDDAITNFLIENIGEEFIVKYKDEADIVINVGDENSIYYFDKFFPLIDKNPYSAQISTNFSEINILGKGNVGYIAAVKELILNFDDFIFVENNFLINDSNIKAIGIYDYLHTKENKKYYNKDTSIFFKLVNNALYDKMFSFEENYIPIDSVDYKIWHLSSNKSSILKSYVDKDRYPIVMSGGLWSDITTWEELGKELANEGYDVYLIEMTGGNNTECDTCYNYPYEYLTDDVYPTYVNYVLDDSDSLKIKYVGHSNGARVALDSLTSAEVDPEIVDTLVLVGVPGAFEELSYFAKIINESGTLALERLDKKEINHFTLSRVAHEMTNQSNLGYKEYLKDFVSFFLYSSNLVTVNNQKISKELFYEYYRWINYSNDKQPGINLNIDYFTLIGGIYEPFFKDNDLIVSFIDEEKIYDNVMKKSNVGNFSKINSLHLGMSEDKNIKELIKKSLNKEVYIK